MYITFCWYSGYLFGGQFTLVPGTTKGWAYHMN